MNFRRIRTLDLYIIRKFLGTYIFAILLILAITVMFDINEKLDAFLKAPLRETIFDYFVCPTSPTSSLRCSLLSP